MEYRTKDGKLFTDLDEANAHEAELLKQEQVKTDEQNALKAKVVDYLMHNLALSCVTIPQEDGDPVVAYYGCADSEFNSKEASIYAQALVCNYHGARYSFDYETKKPVCYYNLKVFSGSAIPKKLVSSLADNFMSGDFSVYDSLTWCCNTDDIRYNIHLGKDFKEMLKMLSKKQDNSASSSSYAQVLSLEDFVNMLMNL